MKILIIEDEKKLADSLRKGLQEQAFAADVVYDGEDGLLMAQSKGYDAIILDVLLPKRNGFEIVESLRKQKINTPILLLTAKDSVADRVKGLNLGADDYLCKPFAFSELLARLQAIQRRKSGHESPILSIEDLSLNLLTREVKRANRKIELRPKEFAILQHLAENRGRVVTRSLLMEKVWDYAFASSSNVIDVHMKRLREKIDAEEETKLIRTVKGVGYTLG